MIRYTIAFHVAALVLLQAGVAARDARSQPGGRTLTITGEAAMVTIAVRADRLAEFDALLEKLKTSLQRSKNPERRAQAAGWQVFRTEEAIQGNATYLMRLDPVVSGQDYDLTTIIAEAFPGEATEVARIYREVVTGQSVMTMNRLAIAGLGDTSAGDGAPPSPKAGVPVLSFDKAQAAVITVLVRPDKEGDYEATLAHLGRALGASSDAGRKRQAGGWKVFKGTQPFSGNVAYVMSLDPLLHRTEYDPMRLIQETYPAEVDAAYQKYRQAYVGQAISRLVNRISMSP